MLWLIGVDTAEEGSNSEFVHLNQTTDGKYRISCEKVKVIIILIISLVVFIFNYLFILAFVCYFGLTHHEDSFYYQKPTNPILCPVWSDLWIPGMGHGKITNFWSFHMQVKSSNILKKKNRKRSSIQTGGKKENILHADASI